MAGDRLSSLAAGEIRTRPFHDDPALIVLVSILLHIALIALLLWIRLPAIDQAIPPAPISVTYVQAPPASAPVPMPVPQTAPVTAPAPVQAAPAEAASGQDMLADAQAFAAMMQQSSALPPMTVVKPQSAPTPAQQPVMHVEGPAPALNTDQPDDQAGGNARESGEAPQGTPGAGGMMGDGGGNGGNSGIGTGGGGTFNEYLVVNVDGSFHTRVDPQLQHFTDGLVACGLRAIDSDNHNWMVQLDVTFTPDGSVTDMRLHPAALPSQEQTAAAEELLRVLRMPGCAKLAPSIFVQRTWHTGEIYLFPLDNPNVPFNLKPTSMTTFRAPDLRLTPH